MIKPILVGAAIAAAIIAGCSSPADVASYNISKQADQFQVNRRIVFVNTWKGEYLLEIDGYCSLGNTDKAREVTVTCMVAPGQYKKHFLGLSSNVTYVVQQLDHQPASQYHYQVLFRPETILPDIRMN